MAVSVREVAATAGVSVGTVSNVLNRPDKVADSTVQRVHAAIDQLGFVRNDAARQLRAGESRTVGLIVLDLRNPFFTEVARGAEERAAELGRPDETITHHAGLTLDERTRRCTVDGHAVQPRPRGSRQLDSTAKSRSGTRDRRARMLVAPCERRSATSFGSPG